MITRFFQSTQYQLVWLASIGGAFLLLGLIPPVAKQVDGTRAQILAFTDRVFQEPLRTIESIAVEINPALQRNNRIELLEQKNRRLYASLAACQNSVATTSASREIQRSIQSAKDTSIESMLSFSGGKWIILSGEVDGIQSGDSVLIESVFLGKVSTVYRSYSVLETLTSTDTPFLIQHEQSKASAVLRTEKSDVTAQFSKRIDELHSGDLFLTVPDGIHAHSPYPVATLDAVLSSATDSISSVRLTPLVRPEIGELVRVIVSKEN